MKLRAVVSFSYQNQSFKNGQEFSVEDEKTAELLLKSGHVVGAGQEQEAKMTARKAMK